MSDKVLFETTLPSMIHNNEVTKELVRIGQEQNYPIAKAKYYTKLETYAGFSVDYMIIANRLPPVPGGWQVQIKSFEPQQRQVMVNVKLKEENGKTVGEVNNLVLRMIEEFRKEGLKIEIEDDCKEFYGNPVRAINVTGHTILQEDFEDFIEGMR